MKIYTPVKNASGVWCSVVFTNGVGETNDPSLIEWFKEHGYKVECEEILDNCNIKPQNDAIKPVDEVIEDVPDSNVGDKPDFAAMTPNDLRQWMMENGYGSKIRNTRNKAKLLEILKE